jgi:hypothetical protein
MNRLPEFNQGERTRANRVQKVTRAKARNTRFRQQATEEKRLFCSATTVLQPARGLLVCLGWLRLFQHIVAPRYALIPRREFRRDHYRR